MFNNASLLDAVVNATMNISTPEATPGLMISQIKEPLFMRVIRLATYIIIFLIAVFGNSLVIFVVYKTKELHTVTGYLIANLAIADLGVGLLCIPFTVIFFELNFIWPFGFIMCKMVNSLQPYFVMGSVATLMAISVDRHQSIVYPFNPRISLTQGKLIIALIWLIALFPALPMLGVSTTVPYENAVSCRETWPDFDPETNTSKLSMAYTVVTFLLTYAIPLPLIIILYIRIGLKLREAIADAADRPGFQAAQMTKRIIKMLVAVVVCYALCYLPFHTIFFTTMTYRSPVLWILQSYSQVLMYFNSASNPILYAFLGDQFKAGFKKILGIKTKSSGTATQTEYVDIKSA